MTKNIQIGILQLTTRRIKENAAWSLPGRSDYALLHPAGTVGGKLHTAGQIAQDELLPQAFAYKILKKLEKAGLVEVVRGTAGGCRLSADLTGTSLYDLMKAMGERGNLSSCMDPAYQCPWRSCHGGCTVHCKLAEIQNKLDEELRAHSLQGDFERPPDLTVFFCLKVDKFYQD